MYAWCVYSLVASWLNLLLSITAVRNRPFYARSKESMMVSNGGYKNRMATVFWYLSNVNVSDGGSTHFPRVSCV